MVHPINPLGDKREHHLRPCFPSGRVSYSTGDDKAHMGLEWRLDRIISIEVLIERKMEAFSRHC